MASSHQPQTLESRLRSHLDVLFDVTDSQTDATVAAAVAALSAKKNSAMASDVRVAVDGLIAKLRTPHARGPDCLRSSPCGSVIGEVDDAEELLVRRAGAMLSRLMSSQNGVRELQELREVDRVLLCVEKLCTAQDMAAFGLAAKAARKKQARTTECCVSRYPCLLLFACPGAHVPRLLSWI